MSRLFVSGLGDASRESTAAAAVEVAARLRKVVPSATAADVSSHRGFAFVDLGEGAKAEEVARAVRTFGGTSWRQHRLRLEPARPDNWPVAMEAVQREKRDASRRAASSRTPAPPRRLKVRPPPPDVLRIRRRKGEQVLRHPCGGLASNRSEIPEGAESGGSRVWGEAGLLQVRHLQDVAAAECGDVDTAVDDAEAEAEAAESNDSDSDSGGRMSAMRRSAVRRRMLRLGITPSITSVHSRERDGAAYPAQPRGSRDGALAAAKPWSWLYASSDEESSDDSLEEESGSRGAGRPSQIVKRGPGAAAGSKEQSAALSVLAALGLDSDSETEAPSRGGSGGVWIADSDDDGSGHVVAAYHSSEEGGGEEGPNNELGGEKGHINTAGGDDHGNDGAEAGGEGHDGGDSDRDSDSGDEEEGDEGEQAAAPGADGGGNEESSIADGGDGEGGDGEGHDGGDSDSGDDKEAGDGDDQGDNDEGSDSDSDSNEDGGADGAGVAGSTGESALIGGDGAVTSTAEIGGNGTRSLDDRPMPADRPAAAVSVAGVKRKRAVAEGALPLPLAPAAVAEARNEDSASPAAPLLDTAVATVNASWRSIVYGAGHAAGPMLGRGTLSQQGFAFSFGAGAAGSDAGSARPAVTAAPPAATWLQPFTGVRVAHSDATFRLSSTFDAMPTTAAAATATTAAMGGPAAVDGSATTAMPAALAGNAAPAPSQLPPRTPAANAPVAGARAVVPGAARTARGGEDDSAPPPPPPPVHMHRLLLAASTFTAVAPERLGKAGRIHGAAAGERDARRRDFLRADFRRKRKHATAAHADAGAIFSAVPSRAARGGKRGGAGGPRGGGNSSTRDGAAPAAKRSKRGPN